MGEQVFMTLRDQGDPRVITDVLRQKVNRTIRENRHFTISEVYEQCPEVSRTVVYVIVTEHLNTAKFVHVGYRGLLVRGGNK